MSLVMNMSSMRGPTMKQSSRDTMISKWPHMNKMLKEPASRWSKASLRLFQTSRPQCGCSSSHSKCQHSTSMMKKPANFSVLTSSIMPPTRTLLKSWPLSPLPAVLLSTIPTRKKSSSMIKLSAQPLTWTNQHLKAMTVARSMSNHMVRRPKPKSSTFFPQ